MMKRGFNYFEDLPNSNEMFDIYIKRNEQKLATIYSEF